MGRRRRKPSPDRKRIADLEAKVFHLEKTVSILNNQADRLLFALAEATRKSLAAKCHLLRLQRLVFAPHPVSESPP